MKIIRIAKKNKLEKVQKLMAEVCEELREANTSSNAPSINLDLIELIESLKD